MLFRRSTLPLAGDASARFLPWLVAFMVFLACLAVAGVLAMERVLARWDRDLSGEITVQIPAGSDAIERQLRLEAVIALLQTTPGVRSLTVLGEDEVLELLEPWLGTAATALALPLPTLIAVTLDTRHPPDLAALQTGLAAAAPGTLVDDHQRWLGDLMALADSIRAAALLVVGLVGLAAVISVIFVTRTGLDIHREVIELLHLMGAQDRYIARQFQRHALGLGLRGGLFGFILAGLVLLGLGWLAGRAESVFLPTVRLTTYDWVVLALLPLAAALIAMWAARATVLRTLARMA